MDTTLEVSIGLSTPVSEGSQLNSTACALGAKRMLIVKLAPL